MKAIVSIIMGSTSDLPVMEKAAKLLDEMGVPFEMNALSVALLPRWRSLRKRLPDEASK